MNITQKIKEKQLEFKNEINYMDNISNEIKEIEKTLQKIKSLKTYQYRINEDEYLIYDTSKEKSRKSRIIYKTDDIYIPLISAKFEVREKLHPILNDFIDFLFNNSYNALVLA